MRVRLTTSLLALVSAAMALAIALASPAVAAPWWASPLDSWQAAEGFVVANPFASEPATPEATTTVFAVIGDYGTHGKAEAAVAGQVQSWHPSFIVTTGDDYYKVAGGRGSARYYRSTGYLYGRWMAGVPRTPTGRVVGYATVNAFFPTLGNHDYGDAKPAPRTYLSYFTLPGAGFASSSGNERYYDFVDGPVHFFVLNSNPGEPNGLRADQAQAAWLQQSMDASAATWNIVVDHHPPFASDNKHGSSAYMQWPFAAWGADAVLSGHAHVYERVMHDGIPYFVNGLGGGPRYGFKKTPVAGSAARYSANWGAQKVTATTSTITFEFYNVKGRLEDRFTLSR